jgi:hypothetical protein
MRFMACIYVEHIFLSRIKRTRIENKFAGLESLLHASRRANSEQIFKGSSADFAGAVHSRIHRKKSRNCGREIAEGSGRAELSGPGQWHHGDAFRPVRATLFFFHFFFERASC